MPPGEVLLPSTSAVAALAGTLTALRRRGGRGLLPAFLCQSGPRDRAAAMCCAACARRCSSPRATKSCASSANTSAPRRRRSTPLSGRASPAICGGSRISPAGARFRRPDLHHALERRHHVDRARRAPAGGDDGIRSGGRHDRRRASRRGCSASQRAIGFDMGGTTAKTALIADGVLPIEEGYVIGDAFTRPADAASGRRHRRGRRRRRLDRLVRRHMAGSMSARSAPAPIRGRPAMAAAARADRDRCGPGARPPQWRALSRRRHDARPRHGGARRWR